MVNVAWNELFVPRTSLLELFIRGSLMYLTLFTLFRVVVKRNLGSIGVPDILMVVLIADGAQNAMSGDYKSIPEGLVVCGTIMFWSYGLDWLSFHSSRIRRLVEPPPLPLIRDGRLQRRNMRRELISEDELMTHLRQEGVEDVGGVKDAFMEPDGQISVIKKKP